MNLKSLVRTSVKKLDSLREDRWRSAPYVSESSPIIIGGCGRSGTTLMRVILDSHHNICCGPETYLMVPWGREQRKTQVGRLSAKLDIPEDFIREAFAESHSQAWFIDEVLNKYCAESGKSRWAEKTPQNVRHLPFIFEHFPNAKFVHMVRDGRDTVCSLRTHPRYKNVNGELVELNTRNPIDQCIERWVQDVQAGLAFSSDPRYMEVRYENLVTNPEPILRELFDFIGEDWDENVLKYNEVKSASRDTSKFAQNPEATQPMYTSALNKWQTELTLEESELFKSMAGQLLIKLGYTRDNNWSIPN